MNERPGTTLDAVQSVPKSVPRSDWPRALVDTLIQLRYVTLLLPVGMVILLLQAIWSHTASVPFEDEWDNVLMVHHFLTGTFSLGEVWAFHNQHRIVIPRLIDLMLTVVTHWNRQIEMTVDVAFALLTVWLFFAALKTTLRSNPITWALLIPISLLVLSLGQFENWLEPFQITFILTIVGIACCVRGLASGKSAVAGFALAVFGATLAALSSLGGTIAFIAFFPIVLYFGWQRAAIWLTVALGVLIPYFIGFPHSSLNLQPVGIVQYELAYLGAPIASWDVSWGVSWAMVAGLIGLVLAGGSILIYWRQHGTLSRMGPWIGLGLFGLGVAGVTALGRNTGGGLIFSLSSRYQAFSGVWWVAVFALMAICVTEIPHTFKFPPIATSIDQQLSGNGSLVLQGYGVLLAACVVLLLLLNNLSAVPALQTFQLGQFQQQSCIEQYLESSPECFQSFYPYPGTAQAYSAVLQEDNMGVFYSTGTNSPAAMHISVAALALNRYVDPITHTYWTAVALNIKQWDTAMAPQYQLDQRLGYLASGPQTGSSVQTVPLFGCYGAGQEYLSLDFTCGGLAQIQVEGWIYTSAPTDIPTVPLYQCAVGTGYMASNLEGCGLKLSGTLLGYLRATAS